MWFKKKQWLFEYEFWKLLYKCGICVNEPQSYLKIKYSRIKHNLACFYLVIQVGQTDIKKKLWTDANFSKHRPSGPMLSISQNVRLSVRVFVRVFVCVFTFEVPFKRLFVPTSRSRMSNIFRDSESLGKSSGKKWSQIWTF